MNTLVLNDTLYYFDLNSLPIFSNRFKQYKKFVICHISPVDEDYFGKTSIEKKLITDGEWDEYYKKLEIFFGNIITRNNYYTTFNTNNREVKIFHSLDINKVDTTNMKKADLFINFQNFPYHIIEHFVNSNSKIYINENVSRFFPEIPKIKVNIRLNTIHKDYLLLINCVLNHYVYLQFLKNFLKDFYSECLIDLNLNFDDELKIKKAYEVYMIEDIKLKEELNRIILTRNTLRIRHNDGYESYLKNQIEVLKNDYYEMVCHILTR
jgi:hypothetical protein